MSEPTISELVREVREAQVDFADGYEWEPLPPEKPAALPPPQPKLAPGFFILIDSLCDRAGIPHGSIVDFYGFTDALSGRKPGTTPPRKPKPATKRFRVAERDKAIPQKRAA